MRPILLTLTLLATTTAFAQIDKAQQDKLEQQVRAQMAAFIAASCPVGIFARQQGSPAAIWTTSLEDQGKSPVGRKNLHSGVHVDINAHKQIKQVELAVHFVPPGTRWLPVTEGQSAPTLAPGHESTKTFTLVADHNLSSTLDGDLLLGPVASITHVSLMHIAYTDGTEWTTPTPGACSVKPGLFMSVENK